MYYKVQASCFLSDAGTAGQSGASAGIPSISQASQLTVPGSWIVANWFHPMNALFLGFIMMTTATGAPLLVNPIKTSSRSNR